MKTIFLAAVASLFILCGCSSHSDKSNIHPQHSDSYEIATWKGFSQSVINYTFDDGCPNQYDVAIPMFDEFGFQLTVYLVSGSVPEDKWSVITKAISNGHEMGSHTVTHPSLKKLSLADQLKEMEESKKTIEEKTGMKRCHTIAYPFCDYPDLDLCSKYYIAGRDCRGKIEKSTPDSYYKIRSIGCGNLSSVCTTDEFKSKMIKAASKNGWCVFLLHGIDNDGGYSPITSQVLRECLEYLDENRDKYWVTSLLNAVLYSKERDAVVIAERDVTTTSITVDITDDLDNAIYNHPLTIRRKMPDAWNNISIKQRGVQIDAKVEIKDNSRFVVFEAIPDNGDVVLSKEN